MRALVVLLVACGSAATPRPTGTAEQIAAPPNSPSSVAATTNDIIVIKASGAASRTSASPRVVRRLLAARRGLVSLAAGYTEVGLTVTEVVSGPLYDPDYARRPVGTNHLEVVLVDEAAYAAPSDMDGFEGTWKLTRLADDTLVASAIEDTPWPASTVAGRRALISDTRKDLRSPLPEQRLAGLDVFEKHYFYELVPDVIALLEDARSFGKPHPPPGRGSGVRVVGEVAEKTLRRQVAPLLDPAAPRGSSPDEWTAFWNARTTQVEMPLPVTPTTVFEHEKLPTYQSWPDFVSTPHGMLVAVTRLETPFESNEDGVFASKDGKRTWLSQVVTEGIDAASNSMATGVLYMESRAVWQIKVLGSGKPRDGKIVGYNAKAVSNVIARADDGFLVLGIEASPNLLALPLDAMGQPRGSTRRIELPVTPETAYTRGIHVLSVARRDRGWVAAINTKAGVYVTNIDASLRLVAATKVSSAIGTIQPKIAVDGDRAFVAWAARDGNVLETVVTDHDGKPHSAIARTASEVGTLSPAVALDDGFAIAWIEAMEEVHIGRWNRDGVRVANVVVQARHAGPFALDLERDKTALVVTYLDQTRYPFPLVSRRIEIAALK